MNAKQFLSRGRWIEKEISSLMRTRDETRDRLTHITQNYDSDGAQSSKDPHKFDALIELEEKLDAKVDELFRIKNEILDTIFKLDDARERMVLKGRYGDVVAQVSAIICTLIGALVGISTASYYQEK